MTRRMEGAPAYDVEVTRLQGPGNVHGSRIQQAVELTLRRHNCQRAAVGIALMDDAQIAELNERHLGRHGPTDVLSFDLGQDDGDVLDGQIAVSVETAQREAQRRGHSVEAEVLLYCIHGTLHLLGYDDADAAEAERMHRVEDELLGELGLGAVYGGRAE